MYNNIKRFLNRHSLTTSLRVFLAGQWGVGSSSKRSNHLPRPWASGRGVWLSCLWCRPGGSTRLGGVSRRSAGWGSPGSGLGWGWCGSEWSGSFCSTSWTCKPPEGEWSLTSSDGETFIPKVKFFPGKFSGLVYGLYKICLLCFFLI